MFDLHSIAEAAGSLTAISALLYGFWRYVVQPCWRFTARLKSKSAEISDALPVLLELARLYPQSSDHSLPIALEGLNARAASTESLLRSLLDHLDVAAFVSNANGDCEWVSRRWLELTGLDQQQASGSGWVLGIAEDDRQEVEDGWKATVDGHRNFDRTYRMIDREGNTCQVRGCGVAVRRNNVVVGYVGILKEL